MEALESFLIREFNKEFMTQLDYISILPNLTSIDPSLSYQQMTMKIGTIVIKDQKTQVIFWSESVAGLTIVEGVSKERNLHDHLIVDVHSTNRSLNSKDSDLLICKNRITTSPNNLKGSFKATEVIFCNKDRGANFGRKREAKELL